MTGGMSPRWGRDGRELFYVAPDNQLMAVPIRTGGDQRTLITDAPVPLFLTRLATGGNLASTGFNSGAQYVVMPDGNFLMNVSADDAGSPPIFIVLNWQEALRR
jgi:hypothetical protein